MTVKTPVYLDHHATTPVDPRVLEKMDRVLRVHFGNPASTTHAYGWAAKRLVDEARGHVAALIGAEPREIVFTSGATEADNLALKGVAERYGGRGDHIVTTVLEHEAVLAPLRQLERRGWRVTRVGADEDGLIDPGAVADAITEGTVLVSVIAAQNEIGTIQPLAEIGELCQAREVLLHTDAAQAAGKIDLDVRRDGIDLLALSGHKLYAPKGVGALYVRRRSPRVSLEPQLAGGGQEEGLRSGTLNVPGIVALGEACRLAAAVRSEEAKLLRALRERFWRGLSSKLEGVRLNGHADRRLPGSLNISFAGLESHALIGRLTVLALSTGSACSSTSTEVSPVLEAIGLSPQLARASLRIGLGRFTTAAEVDYAVETIVAAVTALRGAPHRAR